MPPCGCSRRTRPTSCALPPPQVATEAGLSVVFCIGESLAEREAGSTLEVVFRQLSALADAVPEAAWANIVVAYEPVWAIGTGRVDTKEQAQEVHAEIRKWVAARVSVSVSEALRIVYGGSVNVSRPPPIRAHW